MRSRECRSCNLTTERSRSPFGLVAVQAMLLARSCNASSTYARVAWRCFYPGSLRPQAVVRREASNALVVGLTCARCGIAERSRWRWRLRLRLRGLPWAGYVNLLLSATTCMAVAVAVAEAAGCGRRALAGKGQPRPAGLGLSAEGCAALLSPPFARARQRAQKTAADARPKQHLKDTDQIHHQK